MGLLPAPTSPLSDVANLSASKFARRRLAVVMARTGMVENVQAAIKVVEQGHVRVGTEVSFFLFSLPFLLPRKKESPLIFSLSLTLSLLTNPLF